MNRRALLLSVSEAIARAGLMDQVVIAEEPPPTFIVELPERPPVPIGRFTGPTAPWYRRFEKRRR